MDDIKALAQAEGHLEQLLFGRLNEELHRKPPCLLMFIKHESGPVRW